MKALNGCLMLLPSSSNETISLSSASLMNDDSFLDNAIASIFKVQLIHQPDKRWDLINWAAGWMKSSVGYAWDEIFVHRQYDKSYGFAPKNTVSDVALNVISHMKDEISEEAKPNFLMTLDALGMSKNKFDKFLSTVLVGGDQSSENLSYNVGSLYFEPNQKTYTGIMAELRLKSNDKGYHTNMSYIYSYMRFNGTKFNQFKQTIEDSLKYMDQYIDNI